MNWIKDKSRLEHETQYLCCLDIKNEIYDLMVYYENPLIDVEFDRSGFYYFDEEDDVWRLSFTQPECWCEITKP